MNNNDDDDEIFDMFDIDKKNRSIINNNTKNIIKKKPEPELEQKQENNNVNISNILAKLGKIKKSNENTNITYELDHIKNKLICSSNMTDELSKSIFKYTKKTELKFGPYSDSWVHDSQTDDVLSDEQKRLLKIVKKLLTIEYPAQRSPKWFEMRESSITASDSGCVLNDNAHEPPYKIYIKKLLKPPFEASMFCYHGTKLEQIATMVYEYRMNIRIEEFGLVKHPKYPFLAASPDGIIGKYKLNGLNKTKYVGRMLEIKCPAVRKLRDDNPFYNIKYYEDQVQLQLECCDLEECDFWQNTITEYQSREEFLNDTDFNEPFRSKKTGMEKGCLIQLLPKNKISDLHNDYENIICGYSKFLYPPKIDMTPLECDIWVAYTLNNLEKTLLDNVMKKYNKENQIIQNLIEHNNFADFLQFFKVELNAEIEQAYHNNNWKFKDKPEAYINKVKKSIKDETTETFKLYYYNNYSKKLIDPIKNEKFIRFIIKMSINNKYTNIINDDDLIKKMLDLTTYYEFYKILDENDDLSFIKKLCQMIKDLEFPQNYTYDKVYYWRFEKTLCTTVKRDRTWFTKSLPIFEKTWKNIEFLRLHPDIATKVFQYIDSLPTISEHGNLKDNTLVINFINKIIAENS